MLISFLENYKKIQILEIAYINYISYTFLWFTFIHIHCFVNNKF